MPAIERPNGNGWSRKTLAGVAYTRSASCCSILGRLEEAEPGLERADRPCAPRWSLPCRPGMILGVVSRRPEWPGRYQEAAGGVPARGGLAATWSRGNVSDVEAIHACCHAGSGGQPDAP